MAGLTLDSGALIAYERRDAIVRAWIDRAFAVGPPPIVPAVVVAETWRGGVRSARIARLLKACRVRVVTDEVARRAGQLMGDTDAARFGAVDAIVVVVASERGDTILTSDPGNLSVLAAPFADVEVQAV